MAVRIRWLLTSQSRHLAKGTRTMADITFGHRTGNTPPAPMNHPGQWHYVATRLMAHMRAYNSDEMKGLHWQWHQCASLRSRATMQEHNIWDIPGSPGYQEHASGHWQPRSKDVPEPPRQGARCNSPERPRGPPSGMGSPLACTEAPYNRSPRRGAQAVLTPRGCKAARRNSARTRNPGRSRRRCRTPPPAARRVVFHEGMDRDHGGPYDSHAQRTSSTTISRRRSKMPPNKQAHIPTILTPVERERQAALHAGPRRAADGASSSSAPSLPGSAADLLQGGAHATDTGPREPAADPNPVQGVGGQPPPQPPPASKGR